MSSQASRWSSGWLGWTHELAPWMNDGRPFTPLTSQLPAWLIIGRISLHWQGYSLHWIKYGNHEWLKTNAVLFFFTFVNITFLFIILPQNICYGFFFLWREPCTPQSYKLFFMLTILLASISLHTSIHVFLHDPCFPALPLMYSAGGRVQCRAPHCLSIYMDANTNAHTLSGVHAKVCKQLR